MDQLKGSLRFIPLAAVTRFVASLGSTGRLKLSQGAWSGDITLRNGEVVAARLGGFETGRVALDGLVLGLGDADFAFADEPVDASLEPLMGRDELEAYLTGLIAERERLHLPTDALSRVPCLIDQPANGSEASQVTIQAGALQLIPALLHGNTLEQIAQRRGLARTLRELATLQAGGLARLEAAPVSAQPAAAPVAAAPVAAAPRPVRPAAAPVASEPTVREQVTPRPVRPLRPVRTEAEAAPVRPPRTGWWQTNAAPAQPRPVPAPVQVQVLKPVAAPEPAPSDQEQTVVSPRVDREKTVVSERLDQEKTVVSPRVDREKTVVSERLDRDKNVVSPQRVDPKDTVVLDAVTPPPAPRGRGWRGALVGFFVAPKD